MGLLQSTRRGRNTRAGSNRSEKKEQLIIQKGNSVTKGSQMMVVTEQVVVAKDQAVPFRAPVRVNCKNTDCRPSFQDKASMEQHWKDAHASPPVSKLLQKPSKSKSVPPQASLAAGSKEKVVACNDCGKAFKTTDDLHMHQWDMYSHTRVSAARLSKPPSCALCSKAYTDSDALEKHFMNYHPVANLSQNDDQWTLLATNFLQKWKHPGSPRGTIHKILKVYNLGRRRNNFEEYRKQLKTKAKTQVDKDLPIIKDGNEVLRYHGTKVRCDLGETSKELCSDKGCNLCNILRSGFKTSKCKLGVFQRFGKGIYVSATSSKANDYTDCKRSGHGNQPMKALLVCKVLTGRVYKTKKSIQNQDGPPEGYDSVCGEPGEVLNYDELLMYRDEAILPAFVILYTT